MAQCLSREPLHLSSLRAQHPTPADTKFHPWAGIYICRALQEFAPKAPLKIKWPNDLHCNGRKFAGMLTEAKMDADCMRSIIFGIGLNLNSNPNEYPEGIRQLATSLYAISGKRSHQPSGSFSDPSCQSCLYLKYRYY